MKASPEPGDLTERLARLVEVSGPISVAHYMAEANAHYYATRDPLGATGDFTTAPEISQMFGELVGLWLADIWDKAGRPQNVYYVELGPGRGTLAVDALRAMRAAGLQPQVEFVETSPVLRKMQAERVPVARWHDDTSALPEDAPLLVVANEFFDALPARQLVKMGAGWRERLLIHQEGRFVPVAGPPAPLDIEAEEGAIVETSPASAAIIRDLAARVAAQGGAALVVDYGHVRSGTGDTLQAVESHSFADPWEKPGTRDLTVHVDFQALGEAASVGGAEIHGPSTQGDWLRAMGIDLRTAALAAAAPQRAEEIRTARDRLTSCDQMGSLFKVMALTAPHWPQPEGLD